MCVSVGACLRMIASTRTTRTHFSQAQYKYAQDTEAESIGHKYAHTWGCEAHTRTHPYAHINTSTLTQPVHTHTPHIHTSRASQMPTRTHARTHTHAHTQQMHSHTHHAAGEDLVVWGAFGEEEVGEVRVLKHHKREPAHPPGVGVPLHPNVRDLRESESGAYTESKCECQCESVPLSHACAAVSKKPRLSLEWTISTEGISHQQRANGRKKE